MNLDTPVILLNFKTYKESIGSNAVRLAKVIRDVGYENTYIAVQPTDIFRVKKIWKNVLGQHADPIEPGAKTGWIPVESLIGAGAVGTLINHSEHRVGLDDIKKIIDRSKSGDSEFDIIACADTVEISEMIAKLKPTAVAIEPPELIGTKISVSEAKPELVASAVSAVSKFDVPVLCGAGINKPEDVAKAIDLGAKGVLVASAFVKNENPKRWLEDVISVL